MTSKILSFFSRIGSLLRDFASKQTAFLQNVSYLTVIQVFNLILPLLTVAYLTRTLGVLHYGEVIFALTIAIILISISEFSLSWSGVSKISKIQNNINEVNKSFSNLYSIQLFLTLFLSIMCLIIILLIDITYEKFLIFSSGILLVIGTSFFPLWLYQGLEKMKLLAFSTVISRLFNLILIILFVNSQSNAHLVLALQALSTSFAGIYCFLYLKAKIGLNYNLPSFNAVLLEFKNMLDLFISRFYTSIYCNFSPMLLGSIAGPDQLAIYNVADRLQKIIRALFIPFLEAGLPRVSSLMQASGKDAFRLALTILIIICTLTFFGGVFLIIFGEFLIKLIAGTDFMEAYRLLILFAFMPLIAAISGAIGVQLMIPLGLYRDFRRILKNALIISVISAVPLIMIWEDFGAVASLFITELYVSITMVIYLYKNQLKIQHINQ